MAALIEEKVTLRTPEQQEAIELFADGRNLRINAFAGAGKTTTLKMLADYSHRVDAIKNGRAPAWENHISTYQVDVPLEFGAQFRRIRNRTAHASTKRSDPGTDLSLAKFYELYHLFVYLLYYSAQWLWSVKDVETFDWKAIEEFDLAIQADPPRMDRAG